MAIITVDYDQEAAVKAAAGAPPGYPDGVYALQVLSYEQRPAKSADKSPSIMVKAKIIGSFNGQNLEKPATLFMSLSPVSVPYNLMRLVQALGVPATYPRPGVIVFDPDQMIGGRAEATLKNEKGLRGNLSNWDNWRPVGGAQAQAPQQGFAPQQLQQAPQQMPQQNFGPPQGWYQQQPQFGPPNGGWQPPGAAPQQQPQAPQGYGTQQPQQPTYQQQPPQMAPQGYPQHQQQPTYAPQHQQQQPVYQQQPTQVPPNGGPPAWMQPGMAPPRGNG